MSVIYTEAALGDLDGILAYISSNYPAVYQAFQSRLLSEFLTGPTVLRKLQSGRVCGSCR